MNGVIRLAALGFMGGMLAVMLRRERPEFAMLIGLGISAVILYSVSGAIANVINGLKTMITGCGVDIKYFVICIKAVGIAYIAQFAAEILRDCGEGAIASKVEAAGKIGILALTMPVMKSLLEMCAKVVSGI